MQRKGFEANLMTHNAMVSSYAGSETWQLALGLVEEMGDSGLELDAVTYNTVIGACGKSEEWSRALAFSRRCGKAALRRV
mmetsp:Transcript_87707/g.196379  ORF Transcript_87707/g.196379 Transcript_87707/m.196379 type:complete len:80 (-) Transcript_87707:80-319(-)